MIVKMLELPTAQGNVLKALAAFVRPYIQLTIMQDKIQHQLFTFERLNTHNVWYVCYEILLKKLQCRLFFC